MDANGGKQQRISKGNAQIRSLWREGSTLSTSRVMHHFIDLFLTNTILLKNKCIALKVIRHRNTEATLPL